MTGAPTAVEMTPSSAGSFSVPFTAALPMSVEEFKAQQAGYVSAVAQAAGVDASAVRVVSVSLEPVLAPIPVFNESNTTSNGSSSPSPSLSPTGRRLLSVTTVLVQTEVQTVEAMGADAAAAGLTVDSLAPLLAAEGVPPASFSETPRVVLGNVAALPETATTVGCTLSLTWEEVVAVKLAERSLTCASSTGARHFARQA